MKSAVKKNNSLPLILTEFGRSELQKQINEIREVKLPALAVILNSPDRDERDSAEFIRLTDEASSLESLISEAGKPDVLLKNDKVVLGASVKIQTKKETFVVRVVHPSEAHIDDERISAESPLGVAIMGNKKGDQVTIIAPSGNWTALIKSVELLP